MTHHADSHHRHTDADGDTLAYRYRWYRNEAPVQEWPAGKNALQPGGGKKGESFRVDLHNRLLDGEARITLVPRGSDLLAQMLAVSTKGGRRDPPPVTG